LFFNDFACEEWMRENKVDRSAVRDLLQMPFSRSAAEKLPKIKVERYCPFPNF
jgi:hypothetical protein